ncbi:TetR/AcrR family transcriptional regulator [Nakamurella flavida]|uniref:TetR/AcrR family transcriptional regulator n=1 Tax=Nakamurella flavida TaxID=363630 RepID=A0A939C0P1_9ACTN|nr:TetR/AcrR family transcriptional regulator [Nakamurella flavida]MBM9476923.1 TetR/AcrR family transcriptional regulator [Nakamurella flavida]MDP9779868.1 AcrR family transcriptional regulator [Nakamurella flavida]
MGRRPQPEIARHLLEACTDHALAHGLPDRLETLAAAAGTSSRMLIYHFGSRDTLLRAVLDRARRRQQEFYGELLTARAGEPYPVTLRRAWAEMTGPRGRPYLGMFGQQLRDSTGQRLWPGFPREATTDWLPLLTEGLRTIGRPELATLVLAVIRGLLLDLAATGDTIRTDEAFDHYLVGLTPRRT